VNRPYVKAVLLALLAGILVSSIYTGTWPKVVVLLAAGVIGVWLGQRRRRGRTNV
jgi:uncharacterized membrane protein